MITLWKSLTNTVDVMKTLGSSLPKAYGSGQQERFAPMNQLSLSRMTKYLWHLTLVLTLLVPLTMVDVSYAGGRVFYDGFEDGTTNKWQKDDYRNKCAVVSSAADGAAGPYAGTKMARCNWNGAVAWNDPAAYEGLTISTSNYTNEMFIRIRLRVDANSQRTSGSSAKILRFYSWDGNIYHDVFAGVTPGPALHNATCSSIGSAGCLGSYWGGASGDNTASSTGWHKVEYYFNQSAGTIKIWHDGVLIRNTTGLNFGGLKWSPFYITSNWSDPHGATNYIYMDDVEVFSDVGSGATGSMSDATVSSGSNSPAAPNSPQALTVQ